MSICRIDSCDMKTEARGICIGHLRSIGQQVDAGQATWKQYEDAGICTPIPTKRNRSVCLTNGCPTKPRSRGLCDNCYAAAKRIMEAEGVQWNDLEELGLSLPAKKRAFVKQSLFMKSAMRAIAEARKNVSAPILPTGPDQSTVPETQTQAQTIAAYPPKGPVSVDGVQLPAPASNAFPGFINPVGSAPTQEKMRELVAKHDFQPPIKPPLLIDTPPVGSREPVEPVVDLSRVNAPEPERIQTDERDEMLDDPPNFPAQPTQIPN